MSLSLARTAGASRADSPRRRRSGRLVRLIATVLVLAWLIRSLVVAPFSIPSVSMLPSLFVGDYLLVAKWPYGYSRYSFPLEVPSFGGRILGGVPDRGDVVVFRAPGSSADFVKRVIGLPGDRIELRGGMLILNGRAIAREAEGFAAIPITPNSPCRVVPGAVPQTTGDGLACRYPVYRETLPNGSTYRVIDQVENPRADDLPPTVVPQGHVFLLGDNRDDSLDSRYSSVEGGTGLVPTENLIGRVLLVFWSTDGSANYARPWTWFTALRTGRIGPISSAPER